MGIEFEEKVSRGRKSIEQSENISAEEAKERKRKLNNLRRCKSSEKKKLQSSLAGPSLTRALNELNKKYEKKKVEKNLKKGKLQEKSGLLSSHNSFKGLGKNCAYKWVYFKNQMYDLYVFQSDNKTSSGYALDPHIIGNLSKAELDEEIRLVELRGFVPERYQPPLAFYLPKAKSVIVRHDSGEFEFHTNIKSHPHSDFESANGIKKSATLGFAFAVYIAETKKEKALINGDERVRNLLNLYYLLGDELISDTEHGFNTQVKKWVEKIIHAKIKMNTWNGIAGVDFHMPKQVRARIQLLCAIFRELRTLVHIFTQTRDYDVYLGKSAREKAINTLMTLQNRDSESWRALYREEIKIIVESCPTMHHVSYFVLNLSTGLRPEIIKNLKNSESFDSSTGELILSSLANTIDEDGQKKKIGGAKKHLSRHSLSIVSKTILSTPEIFHPKLFKSIVRYFEDGGFKKIAPLKDFAKQKNIRPATQRMFRSTCAKNLYQSGQEITEIAMRLGNSEDVASKHYANRVPPDAYDTPRGEHFYAQGLDFAIDGVEVCRKDCAWDGWLLWLLITESVRRARNFHLRNSEEQAENAIGAFKDRLSARILACYNYHALASAEVKGLYSKYEDKKTMDRL